MLLSYSTRETKDTRHLVTILIDERKHIASSKTKGKWNGFALDESVPWNILVQEREQPRGKLHRVIFLGIVISEVWLFKSLGVNWMMLSWVTC